MPTEQFLRNLGVTLVKSYAGISEYRLNFNSLKILLSVDPSARVCAVIQHINVGSRHEGAGNTGYSHLLEHMLFKGTPTFNQTNGNSYDDFMKLMGGNYNATTSGDRTNYHAKVPSAFLRDYLAYEADRLRNAILTDGDLETEMPVVIDEFDMGENNPDRVLQKMLMSTMYTEHPYKVSTIGSRSEVIRVTAQSLKNRLYDVYYHPNNATLIVVGGFDTEQVLNDIVDLYGKIPPSAQPIPTPYTVEPEQFGERRFAINKPGDLPRVMIGFHVPQADHEDSYALQALALILGGGESSRLFRKLVNKGLASSAGCGSQLNHDPGAFIFYAKLTPGTKPQTVEKIILKEIERISRKLVSKRELKQVMDLNRNGTVMLRANRLQFASSISEHEAVANWLWGEEYDDHFEQVTREGIVAVAARYLKGSNRTIGYFLPSGQPSELKQSKSAAPIGVTDEPTTTHDRSRLLLTPQPATSSYAHDVKKTRLANGLTVMLLPSTNEAVGVSLVLNSGSHCHPSNTMLASMVSEMLTEGSAKYSKAQIADFATRMGQSFGFSTDVFRTSCNTLVASRLAKFLDLLADVLRHPLFRQAELDLLKTRMTAALKEAAENPDARAITTLRQTVYTPADMFYALSIEEKAAQVQAVTVEDLNAFHQAYYGPTDAVLTLVGNFNTASMLKLIESKFGTWTGGIARPSAILTAAAPEKSSRVNVQINGKDNLTILVGRPVDLLTSAPDFLAAAIANKALGGDTLTSRLGLEIREKRGLTYGITCGFGDTSFGGALWTVRMTTNRDKAERAIQLIYKVVNIFVAGGIGESELAAEKIGMSTSFDLQLDNPLSIAGTITNFEHSKRGLESLDSYQARLAAVTKRDVDAAIAKYFLVDQSVTIVAGNI